MGAERTVCGVAGIHPGCPRGVQVKVRENARLGGPEKRACEALRAPDRGDFGVCCLEVLEGGAVGGVAHCFAEEYPTESVMRMVGRRRKNEVCVCFFGEK